MASGATAGPGRTGRLDPQALPARSSASCGAAGPAFTIESHRVVICRTALDATIVPVTDYRGVAVRMVSTGDDGEVRAFVELLHTDPELTLTLAVADDPYDIAADWQAWARTLHLPLLIVGQDGSVAMPLANLGGVIAARPQPRRRHSYFAARRPRFLKRRKTGRTAEAPLRLVGREIIARD